MIKGVRIFSVDEVEIAVRRVRDGEKPPRLLVQFAKRGLKVKEDLALSTAPAHEGPVAKAAVAHRQKATRFGCRVHDCESLMRLLSHY